MKKRTGTDVAAQTAFIGMSEDDVAFRKEKRRKYGPKVELPSIPDGPCCLRCRNWLAPDDDDFGSCQKLVTIRAATPGSPERGYTASIEDALSEPAWSWEFMRTRPAFAACSRFASAAMSMDAESEAA